MGFACWVVNMYFDFELALDMHVEVDANLKKLYVFYASKLTSSSAHNPSSSENESEVTYEYGDLVGREIKEIRVAETTLALGKNVLDMYLEDNLLVAVKLLISLFDGKIML